MKSLKRPNSGFTLLELLVVLFIISIITGFTVLSVGSRKDTRFSVEIKRLVSIMGLLNEEAIFNNETFALCLRPDGYDVVRYLGGGKWELIKDDKIMAKRDFPGSPNIELTIEERDVVLDPEPDINNPHIIFIATGEITPFTLEISRNQPEDHYRITGTFAGEIKLESEKNQ